jgi:hypothetical protein
MFGSAIGVYEAVDSNKYWVVHGYIRYIASLLKTGEGSTDNEVGLE